MVQPHLEEGCFYKFWNANTGTFFCKESSFDYGTMLILILMHSRKTWLKAQQTRVTSKDASTEWITEILRYLEATEKQTQSANHDKYPKWFYWYWVDILGKFTCDKSTKIKEFATAFVHRSDINIKIHCDKWKLVNAHTSSFILLLKKL